MGTVLIDLSGILSGEVDKIMSWHQEVPADNISFFECPVDFSFEKYNYTPQIPGVFDPNGFILKPIIEEE